MNNNSEHLEHLRHSAAHLLAGAVLELYPDAKLTLGPAIESGFYYDIDFGDVTLSVEDLPTIEKKMKDLVNDWKEFTHREVTAEEAKELYKDNEYKLEMIHDIAEKGEQITLYTCGNFTDLCRGGHVDEPRKELRAFKLMSVAGAYWRGDEKNPMLTRIYGAAFETKEELKAHLDMLEEAKKRDHRKIGKEQKIYFIDDMVGKGLVMWLPNGVTIRDEIETLAREKEAAGGYLRVVTPHIAKQELFLTSGHLPYYEEDMYPKMEMDDGTYYMKAMNCPHHHRIYQYEPHSYRELPLRFAEYGTVYRNELSGTLAGLLRVRGMAMNDAHLYCRKDQIKEEFKAVMQLTMDYFKIFGLNNYWFRLSKWSPDHTEKYINEPENWKYSEQVLREVLEEMKVEFVEVDDEAAFYGPKVDVQVRSVIGREETMSTIQLDFLAKSRFGLSYTDEEGNENNDVFVIHRAPLSVHERFLAFLIEHYAGVWPVWLSPVQVHIVPVSEKHVDGARTMISEFIAAGIRVSIDDADETVGKKIRNATKQKHPYILVVGDKELSGEDLMIRVRGQEEQVTMSKEAFIEKVKKEILERSS
ncbi:MAG: threonine--tRNA ligase [Candidatus Magasanikbacteria bacterium CG_4_10_14_0_2_um_filter_41_10]|uniref:Threonine--tRNA ligase n=2 Tax=Candidatus Magasanikiibacteriota TaxID=1752731 RepID=A0A2M7V726_9BACT|nr:MAG: threonine--tRNA ligase [Candidatus Magasanikbacteria bacterium CG_4_10_14_0_2_um_filter_41_10]